MKQPARIAPLLAALGMSALVHALTLSSGWLRVPQTPADATPLTVRLEPEPPVLPRATTPAPRARVTKPAHAPLAAAVAAAPAALMTDAPAPWALPPPAAEPAAEPEAPAVMAQAETLPPNPEPIVVANAAPSTFTAESAIIKTLPRRGRIDYKLNIYLSNLPTYVAQTVQTWEAVGNVYKLDSKTEPVGLASWFSRHKLRAYRSSGEITERGLRPRSFTAKVVVSGKVDDTAAQFDWNTRLLQFGRPGAQKTTALAAGSQDLLSFMFQFSLAPPARGRTQMPITDGANFEHRELDVLNEETIATPVGNLRALPVKQVRREGSESIEVWLAVDYHYLPVRIQYNNRDGTPGGELIVTAIHIE